jgi:hypothetical protein
MDTAALIEYGHDPNIEGFSVTTVSENVNTSIINIELTGTKLIKRWQAQDGTFWCLVEYKKFNARDTIIDILNRQEEQHEGFITQHVLELFDSHLALNEKPLIVGDR